MSDNPYATPNESGGQPQQKRFSPITRFLELFLAVAIIGGLLFALLLPATRSARPAARRTACMNNLKQIALALHNYHDTYDALPPAYTVDADGKPLHSWRTLILPFLDQMPLYDKIDLSKPWNDPANAEAYATPVPTYTCPSAEFAQGFTNYLAVTGANGCFRRTEPRMFSEITDGTSNTLMVVETGPEQAVHWMEPRDADEQMVLHIGQRKELPHSSGGNFLFADGAVRFVSSETSHAELRTLISIAGNDNQMD